MNRNKLCLAAAVLSATLIVAPVSSQSILTKT